MPEKPARRRRAARRPRARRRRARRPRPRRGPPRERLAASELRAAARARKRQERRELKRFTRRARQRRVAWVTGIGAVADARAAELRRGLLAAARAPRHPGRRHQPARLRAAASALSTGSSGCRSRCSTSRGSATSSGEFPLIRSYATELLPPDTLVIHVTERTPIGVDRARRAVRPRRPRRRRDHLDAGAHAGDAARHGRGRRRRVGRRSARSPRCCWRCRPSSCAQVDAVDRVDPRRRHARADRVEPAGGVGERGGLRRTRRACWPRSWRSTAAADRAVYDVSAPGSAVFRAD